MPRALELIVTLFGLIFLLPVLIIISIVIVLNTRGSIFYHAERVGQYGKSMRVIKFRTMVKDASKVGPPITTRQDGRITFVGRLLRRTKLDELPQLINVFQGSMRLVGPRPEDPRIVREYTGEQKKILDYKPGITSPASITYKTEENSIPTDQWQEIYMSHILPNKIMIDLDYMRKANIKSDFLVILKTLGLFKKLNV